MNLHRIGNLGRSGDRVHSLLPPNFEDANSIYSEDRETPLSGYDIRPPERHRSIPTEPQRLKESESKISRRTESNPSSKNIIDVLGNLHGTEIDGTQSKKTSKQQETVETSVFKIKNKMESNKPRKSKTGMNRLKSFFSTATDTF